MGSFHCNNVEAEKAEAMRRYNRHIKLKSFLFLVEIVVALALLSWSSYTYIPVAAEMAKGFLCQPVVLFGRSLFVLMIVNVLILLIFVSSQTPAKSDFYDEYVNINSNISRRSIPAAEQSPDPKETTVYDKQIVCVDNAVNSPVEKNILLNPTATLPESELEEKHVISPVRCSTVDTVSESKKYTRSRSERLEQENRRELRRSKTAVKRDIAGDKNEPARRSSAIDDLSSEDFKLAIETFIASQKKTLIRENTLDLKLERNQCLAITMSAAVN
ncbi:uncharacterized protein LOC123229180 [Mangifera indica]|uniref:uncharacterized protein LOC123229180 n=1 Tax=Mangifera indica TaxID=29780 RepID=UPI001CFBA70C|nr:uncharacterized protein LOC123229180 [Mangifera indica]